MTPALPGPPLIIAGAGGSTSNSRGWWIMIPWPIALLTLFYGAVAGYSAAGLWKIVVGRSHQSAFWACLWLGLSAAATAGLIWLKPWGRRLAIGTSWLLIVSTLAVAGLFVAASRPLAGLAVTMTTACHYLMIRYLKRPNVLAWFGELAYNSKK